VSGRGRTGCLVLLVFGAALWGCEPRTVVVAEAIDAGASEDAALPPVATTRCASNRDCAANAYCRKRSCLATDGRCTPRPASCDDTEAPRCGCDGVTYFNACLLQQHGQNGRSEGVCTQQVESCNDAAGDFCPGDSLCARLSFRADECRDAEEAGACWVLPPRCAEPADHDPAAIRLRACGEDRECVDLCNAVELGSPFVVAESCVSVGFRGDGNPPRNFSSGFP